MGTNKNGIAYLLKLKKIFTKVTHCNIMQFKVFSKCGNILK